MVAQYENPVGISTGWLSAKLSVDLSVHEQILRESAATAVELVWHDEARRQAMLNGSLSTELFDYRSLHLPSFKEFSFKLTSHQQTLLNDIKSIVNRYKIEGTSLHPDTTPSHVYTVLSDLEIPCGIENMDRDKEKGKFPGELSLLLTRHNLLGVIDLQHAYEVAKDEGFDFQRFLRQLATTMTESGQGITHLHVSGEVVCEGKILSRHAQLTNATNKKEIVAGIQTILQSTGKPIPIILEGDSLPRCTVLRPQEALSEDEFERRFKNAIQNAREEIQLIRDELYPFVFPKAV